MSFEPSLVSGLRLGGLVSVVVIVVVVVETYCS